MYVLKLYRRDKGGELIPLYTSYITHTTTVHKVLISLVRRLLPLSTFWV